MTGCHIEQKNQPGNWVMDQNTPSNGERCFGHFYAPSRCYSMVQVGPKMGIFGVDFFAQYGILSFWLFLTPKIPIFGPTWTWNGTWMGHKSVQHIFPHCLACILTHFPVSRWVIGLIWQPSIMVYFDPKKGHFWTPPDLEWDQERS